MRDGFSSHGIRSYPLRQLHHYRGKEPKLTSLTPSGPTIYQTSITKLLELEASDPYLKNFPKEDQCDWNKAQSLRSVLGIVLILAYCVEDKGD